MPSVEQIEQLILNLKRKKKNCSFEDLNYIINVYNNFVYDLRHFHQYRKKISKFKNFLLTVDLTKPFLNLDRDQVLSISRPSFIQKSFDISLLVKNPTVPKWYFALHASQDLIFERNSDYYKQEVPKRISSSDLVLFLVDPYLEIRQWAWKQLAIKQNSNS